MREVKSCGFLVMKPDRSFLLMTLLKRFDLPKGHMEPGENEMQTAFRGRRRQRSRSISARHRIVSQLFILELMEETSIQSTELDVDPNFRFEHVSSIGYDPRTLSVLFLGVLALFFSISEIWR